MTSNPFKERYRNHIKSLTRKKYSNETELSKHVWHLKQNKFLHGRIKNFGQKNYYFERKKQLLVNKRSEIVSACQHKSRFQVNNLNKERMHAIQLPTQPRFLLEHKKSSHIFEIFLLPEDSFLMK